ncbi:hypothetical protein KL86DPRO_11860 [uncultured delta proteobacterium]|uniref:Uncharacterized protein n=1 Tax=uncultured delta proteobacterium TaxID=34034 RepID=A0A212JN76_9DELT|nr:hypothetical protein KL86DPRO_11860 [uncultured delta proteobacterium]
MYCSDAPKQGLVHTIVKNNIYNNFQFFWDYFVERHTTSAACRKNNGIGLDLKTRNLY